MTKQELAEIILPTLNNEYYPDVNVDNFIEKSLYIVVMIECKMGGIALWSGNTGDLDQLANRLEGYEFIGYTSSGLTAKFKEVS